MSEYTGPIHDDRPKKMVCEHCGSENIEKITQDSIVRWSVECQIWEVSSLLDIYDCNDCGGETSIKEELL